MAGRILTGAELDLTAAEDMLAQERASAEPVPVGDVSDKFVRAVHPEHGEAVVYLPGEALPGWLVEALPGAVADPADARVVVVGGQ